MKKIKKLIPLLLVILFVCSSLSFSASAAAKIHLAKSSLVMTVGGSYTQKLYDAKNKVISNKKITWKTADKSIVKIDQNGKVTAIKVGDTKVTAKYGKTTYTCKVTVKKASFKYAKKTVTTGGYFVQVLKSGAGKDIDSSKIKWSSADNSIATVSSKGKVTAKKAGTVKITAKYLGKKYSFTVTVKNATFKYAKKTVEENKSFTQVLNDASGKAISASKIKWTSANKSIATVNTKGKITGKNAGTVKISADYLGKTYTCVITVKSVCNHDYGDWKITVPATPEKEGVKTRVCDECGKKETAPVKTGEMSTRPYSGQSGKVLTITDWKDVTRKIKYNVNYVLSGDRANELAESENMFNEEPGDGYNWKFFFVEVEYISSTDGYGDLLEGSDLIYEGKIYNSNGSKAQIKEMATLGEKYSGQDIFDVELYPGSSATIVYGVLISDKCTDLVVKLEDVWVSLNAPELPEDAPELGPTFETDSVENIAANTIVLVQGKLKNPSSFRLNDVMYKKSSYYDWEKEELVEATIVYVWYSAANSYGGMIDGYAEAWYSDEILSGLSSDYPYYNIEQDNGGYVVVDLNVSKPSTWDGTVKINDVQKALDNIDTIHFITKWLYS